MYESISKNNELENEMTLDMSYFWYSDDVSQQCGHLLPWNVCTIQAYIFSSN